MSDPIWQAGDDDGNFGDTMEVTHWRDRFSVEINEPWAGCTETGFGQTGSITLSRADAESLRDWLSQQLLSSAAKPKGTSHD